MFNLFLGFLIAMQISFIAIFNYNFGDKSPLILLPVISTTLTILLIFLKEEDR